MNTYFEDPILRVVLFDLRDVLTSSSTEFENPDEEDPGGDTPIIP